MKNLPPQERPYEKCIAHGPAYLSDAELLAVILKSGSQGESALELSRRLLSAGQAGTNGLLQLYHITAEELMKVKGIGQVKAVQLLCVAELSRRMARAAYSKGVYFKTPNEVADYYMEELRHEEQEVLMLVMLNSKGLLLHDQIISRGTVSSALISPREIFLTALKYQAVSIILIHNHPSGLPEPSQEDKHITRRVMDAGRVLGIELADHIIIGDRRAVSLRELGLWQ